LAQDYFITEKFELSDIIEETSGLIYFNNRLITHNDAGNEPKLYEIDTITSNINRIVSVTNASNVDWEDLAQDENYIYIGDIGNNNGNRTDLKVYRILKNDYLNSTSITADIIHYSYADQSDFTSNPHNTNWDAESLLVWEDQLFIFSKNWIDHKVNLYVLPKIPGTYTANIQSSYNLQGLATSATLTIDNIIYLLAYTESKTPFFVIISEIDLSVDYDLFNKSNQLKYTNILAPGNQTEAICYVNQSITQDHLFVSSEKESSSPPKLRTIDFKRSVLGLGNSFYKVDKTLIFPNPFTNNLNLKEKVTNLRLYNSIGKLIIFRENCQYLDTSYLDNGIYYIEINTPNKKLFKIMIKN
jgi:hypothetical protein